MPSSFAHHRFGESVMSALPADVCGLLQRQRKLFELGLQGPDFFYFYRFWSAAGAGVRDCLLYTSPSPRD